VQDAKSRGIHVGLATSRPLHGVTSIITKLDLFSYCVLLSGSQIYDPRLGKIVYEKNIPRTTILDILAVAERYGEVLKMFDGEKEVVMSDNVLPHKVVGVWFPVLKPAVLKHIHSEIQKLPGIATHRMEAWEDGFECLDITHAEASKLHGVVEVCRLIHIEPKEAIGVGDGYNDFPLLLACGLKVAMGNAVPELKAIADFIAPPVEEDGVATVIEKFILSQS
jgi:hydroxymethylpyrimidine pyrophosphatase-like HAD family hydrolase